MAITHPMKRNTPQVNHDDHFALEQKLNNGPINTKFNIPVLIGIKDIELAFKTLKMDYDYDDLDALTVLMDLKKIIKKKIEPTNWIRDLNFLETLEENRLSLKNSIIHILKKLQKRIKEEEGKFKKFSELFNMLEEAENKKEFENFGFGNNKYLFNQMDNNKPLSNKPKKVKVEINIPKDDIKKAPEYFLDSMLNKSKKVEQLKPEDFFDNKKSA